jgi:hypothetical protein
VPITFDTILASEGIEPGTVHLVRHQDTRWITRGSAYNIWREDPEEFRRYQSLQGGRIFIVGNLVASFVVTPSKDTLFVGLYKVEGEGRASPGTIDPLSGSDVSDHIHYEMISDPRLDEYIGKLVIDWGLGYRSWVQRGGRREKPVLELRPKFEEPHFPGPLRFKSELSQIDKLPTAWIEILRNLKGIYVIACPRDNKQYVGSAGGAEGFYGRWIQHLTVGGDAVEFKKREPSAYLVSILEVVGSAVADDEIVRIEQLWMEKLQTRRMGLNGNSVLPEAAPMPATAP